MTLTELEERVGGELTFHMGPNPEESSRGRVTAFEPHKRVEYEEYWDALVGREGADVTPLVTEFVIEPAAGGTCLVRVVTSAFGTGADWENEFFADMDKGWLPMLDNLRIYLESFAGQRASVMWASAHAPGVSPETAMAAVRAAAGVQGAGDVIALLDTKGRVERSLGHHFLMRIEHPVEGFVNFFAHGDATNGTGLTAQCHVFADAGEAFVERERPRGRLGSKKSRQPSPHDGPLIQPRIRLKKLRG
jgi:uncharacterized protein YndB with AHSA1/START domain